MKFSRILFIAGVVACWILTYVVAKKRKSQSVEESRRPAPILLGTLPDLPPIVLPPLEPTTPSAKSASSPKASSASSDENGDKTSTVADSDTDSDADSDAEKDPYGTEAKVEQLKFTPKAPPPAPRRSATPDGSQVVDFRDIPMFTPRDALVGEG